MFTTAPAASATGWRKLATDSARLGAQKGPDATDYDSRELCVLFDVRAHVI